MVITFVGHSDIDVNEKLYKSLKEIIIETANSEENVHFYCGGYGDFDNICAKICRELKNNGLECEIIYVTPYITESQQRKIKYLTESKIYDSTVYPPLENVPYKFAISKRNEWMIKNSDIVIAYVKHSFGGAYRSLVFAKRQKKAIINIAR